jgi:(p)ppGpp synthase/HD superfamily hydrolase
LADLTNILSSENVNITRVESYSPGSDRPAAVEMTLEVVDVKQLQRIIAAMKRVPEVREVARSTRS